MSGATVVTESSLVTRTDAGMFALWNPGRFTAITSYQAWEEALLDDQDIARHVRAGDLAPVSIGSDGAFAFLVRIGAPVLTARERRYLVASSEPYRYLSAGVACLSGIEDICADPGPAVTTLAVPAGQCAVTVHLIGWDAEPGARDGHSGPAPAALPDFVVLICPSAEGTRYRTELRTFDGPVRRK